MGNWPPSSTSSSSSSSATTATSSCFFPGSRHEKEGAFVSVDRQMVGHGDDDARQQDQQEAGVEKERKEEEITRRTSSSTSTTNNTAPTTSTTTTTTTTPKKNGNGSNGTAVGRELMRLSSFDKINHAFRNLINPSHADDPAVFAQEPTRSPPKPKRMLWGCHTVEEHYEYIREACDKIRDKRGEEGLALLGLEFQFVRCSSSGHKCECCCGDDDNVLLLSHSSVTSLSSSSSSSALSVNDDDNNNDFEDDDENDDYGYHHHEPESYMVPIGGGGDLRVEEEDNGPPGGRHDVEHDASAANNNDEGFLAPIGQPLNDHPLLSKSALDLLALRQEMMESSDVKIKRISRVMSAASMFSLATHQTYTSSEGGGSESADNNNIRDDNIEQEVCTMRLFHNPTGELITERNYMDYIARGRMYDEVARLCQDVAQDAMIEAGDLEWITLSGKNGGTEKDDNKEKDEGGEEERIPIRALVSRNNDDDGDNRPGNTLLIVTGKGEVRAGIFSRRHLITSGIEVSTALPYIREGLRRRMSIVMLDPNARGWKNGLQTVQISLERLFLDGTSHHDTATLGESSSSIYVLAHSMAGSQLVRFLLDKTTKKDAVKDMSGNTNSKNMSAEAAENVGISLLQRIKAIAFTDANHNVGWVKTNPPILNLIEGSQSLYIKSHKVHEDAKALGDVHRDCDFWKRRFGKIRTIWAGTNEHALTNYSARWYIWDHFDQHLDTAEVVSDINDDVEEQERGNFAAATGNNKEDNDGDDDEGALSF